MLIQIGMSCDPQWLCDGIGWVLAIVLGLMLIGLARVIIREVRASRAKKRYKIQRSARKREKR